MTTPRSDVGGPVTEAGRALLVWLEVFVLDGVERAMLAIKVKAIEAEASRSVLRAAMAAVPDGWGIEICPNTTNAPARNGRWFARVVRDIPSIGRGARTGYGDEPDSALAALLDTLTETEM